MGCISLLHTTTLHLHYYNGGSISLLHTTTLHLHYYNRGSISLLHTTTLHLHYYNGGCISLLQEREGTPRANQYPRPPIKSCPPISRVFQHCPSTSSRPRIVSFLQGVLLQLYPLLHHKGLPALWKSYKVVSPPLPHEDIF